MPMPGEIKNALKVAGVYTTTIIGAGFASGQEIARFFSSYHEGGFYGIILAGVLFSAVGCFVLERVYSERIRSYNEFIYPVFGFFMGRLVDAANTLFMFFVFCIMVAGSASILTDQMGISPVLALAISGAVYMLLIMTSIRGIVALSSVVTPVLIAGMALVGFSIIIFKDAAVFNYIGQFTRLTRNWFFSSLLYVSYNSLLGITVLCSLLPYLKTRRTGFLAGVLGGAVLCFLALLLNYSIYLFRPVSLFDELPMLHIAGKYSGLLGGFYAFIVWLAMFTSAVTSGYCFIERLSSRLRVHYRILTPVVCALVVPLAGLGFSNLISAVYPVFGYIGMFVVFAILLQGVKDVAAGTFRKH